MPSAPRYPIERSQSERPTGSAEYTAYAQFDGFEFTLAAGAAFQEAKRFAGRPDAIVIRNAGSQIRVRFRARGLAANQPYVQQANTTEEYKTGAEIIEVQDPSAGGGQFITGYGLYGSRNIERRNSHRGPLRELLAPTDQQHPETYEPH